MSDIKSQEAKLLRIVEGSSDGLWDWNLQTNEVFFNRQSYVLLDIPDHRKAPPGFNVILDRLLPEDRHPTELAMQALIEEGIPYRVDHRICLPDGSIRTLLCKGLVTERDALGQPSVISGTISDITHLKHIERSLKETRERLDRVISGSDEGYWEWDVQYDTLYWSDRVFELLGIEKVDFPLNYQFYESFLVQGDRSRIKNAMDKTMQSGCPFFEEFKMRHASGEERYFYSRAKPYYDEHCQLICVSGMIADITKQKEQELLLTESEQRFRKLAEASPAMIWMANERYELVYMNNAYQNFFGGKHIQGLEWKEYLHPDDLKALLEKLDEFSTHPRQEEVELRIRQPDGSYRWSYTICALRFDDNGKFLGYMGSTVDVTNLKQTEQALKEYASRLERSNQELDQFVLVASHDLQEPLRKISLFGGFLKEVAGDKLPSECNDYIERMQNAVIRMQTLLDDLLTLSRITRKGKPLQPTDLGLVLQSVLAELEKKRKEANATIIIENSLTIDVDENQVHQVFLNLLDNALKFRKKDTPSLIVVNMKLLDDGATCEISVTDNGIGFDEKYLDRVFQIFERLHGRTEYEGSGIGLAIVQKIVERHHGVITAHSVPGEGSTFTIRMPVHAEKV